jgi:hypothetical protein
VSGSGVPLGCPEDALLLKIGPFRKTISAEPLGVFPDPVANITVGPLHWSGRFVVEADGSDRAAPNPARAIMTTQRGSGIRPPANPLPSSTAIRAGSQRGSGTLPPASPPPPSPGTRIRSGTASVDNTARIWPAHGEYFQSLARSRTRLCLPSEFRRVILEECSSAWRPLRGLVNLLDRLARVPTVFSRDEVNLVAEKPFVRRRARGYRGSSRRDVLPGRRSNPQRLRGRNAIPIQRDNRGTFSPNFRQCEPIQTRWRVSRKSFTFGRFRVVMCCGTLTGTFNPQDQSSNLQAFCLEVSLS